MNDDVIKHGRSYIWDMEIDDYDGVYLNEFFEDTIIDFEYIYCDEAYVGLYGLQRMGELTWKISVPIKCIQNGRQFETACQQLSKHCDFLIDYIVSKHQYDDHQITIRIDKNMSICEAFNYAIAKRDDVIAYVSSLEYRDLAPMVKSMVIDKLPVYSRAMKKVELELSNFTTDDKSNIYKIIEIGSRVKTVDSIREKIYRKKICQFDLFDRFDDIAGVRCTCEFLSDVYDVLEYIKQNPLLDIKSVEDKIDNPSEEGYRGIHIIVTTDVYYHGVLYECIKVEIQLRTAFQNAWSMKTHQLTYKQETVHEDVANTMRMMSDALKEADDAAQKIRDTLRGN